MNARLAGLCRLYTEALEGAARAITPQSPYLSIAEEILEMAFAYLEDGVVFYKRGDPVNALAAWCYGFGWLDAGGNLGLITSELSLRDMIDLHGTIPPGCHEQLAEKTARYRRMLNDASRAIEDAPDPSSPIHPSCSVFRDCVEGWRGQGDACLTRMDHETALAWYSYAYGWLDCGVRAGLFRITGDRHLFTA